MAKLRAAILCGGAGTRLWPLSRIETPKQFHSLVGERSLLVDTLARANRLDASGVPMIITAAHLAEMVSIHAGDSGASDVEIIVEPTPRNTAPAAALAALAAAEEDPKTVIALLPSDHHVRDEVGFVRALGFARELAEEGAIATLGITPSGPHTGYGYIHRAESWKAGFHVSRFVEKPDLETASSFFSAGTYYWNAGIYLFRADVFLAELARFQPIVAEAATQAWSKRTSSRSIQSVDAEAWSKCPSISIDHAVAENTKLAAVVPADVGWSDVGSWASLLEIAARDPDGNVLIGDASAIKSSGSYVRSTSRHLSVIGATDLIVIETADAVLVLHKDYSEHVKTAAGIFTASRTIK